MNKIINVVLITESRLLNCIIEKALDPQKYELHTLASDMPDIIVKLTHFKPGLIFLRTILKNKTGYEICKQIKTHPAFKKTPVILISSDKKNIDAAIDHRASYFLCIPFSVTDVRQAVENILVGKKTILYVDDSKLQHKVVVPSLIEGGYHVLEAYNGKEALDIIDEKKIDLLISDIEMPVMDGYSLCQKVKLKKKEQDIPVLIISSLDSEESVSRGFNVGADDYIIKPIVVAELLSRVKRMLNSPETVRMERILVIDDSEMIRALIVRNLEAQGFEVDEASDGYEGLKIVQSNIYHLIISDYEMPKINGYKFCFELRQNEKTADIPIIMISGRDSKAELVKVRSTGVQAVISKPFHSDRLVAEVERVLAEARLHNQRQAMRYYLSEGAINAINRLSNTWQTDRETIVWDKFRTILFVDIVKFTPLCEKLSSQEVIELLNLCFEKMVKIMLKYQAIIDKFIGDAILVLYGQQEDGAHRAICTAVDLIKGIKHLREETGRDLHIRVGINSGHVIVGDIGSRLYRRDFTVIGDNVNIAQRLESLAPVDGILISENTYELVKNIVEVEPAEKLSLKGKENTIRAFRVKSIQPNPALPTQN